MFYYLGLRVSEDAKILYVLNRTGQKFENPNCLLPSYQAVKENHYG